MHPDFNEWFDCDRSESDNDLNQTSIDDQNPFPHNSNEWFFFDAMNRSAQLADDLDNIRFQPACEAPSLEIDRIMEELAELADHWPEQNPYELMKPFYHALINTEVIVPRAVSVNNKSSNSNKLSLVTVVSPTGEKGLPVFTSVEALEYWVHEATPYVKVPFRKVCQKAKSSNLDFILVNAAGPARGELTPYEIFYMADGLIPPGDNELGESLNYENESVAISPLSNDIYPDLNPVLINYFRRPDVPIEEAYWFNLNENGTYLYSVLGVVLTDSHAWGEHEQNLAALLSEMDTSLNRPELIVLKPDEPIYERVKSSVRPFYGF